MKLPTAIFAFLVIFLACAWAAPQRPSPLQLLRQLEVPGVLRSSRAVPQSPDEPKEALEASDSAYYPYYYYPYYYPAQYPVVYLGK